jgi:hypothetical protein
VRRLAVLLALAALGCRGGPFAQEVDVASPWENMSNVSNPPRVEVARAARFDFAANEGGWTNVFRPVDWPPEADAVSLEVRAVDAPCRFRLKLNEMKRGLNHGAFEGFGAVVEATAEWRSVTVPLAAFEYLWGHPSGNRELDPDRISGVGFEQEDPRRAISFEVARIALVSLPRRAMLVDDFEPGGGTAWKRLDSGSMRSEIEAVRPGKSGARAARVEFSGERAAGSWTDLHRAVEWPAGGGFDTVAFWARADAPSRVLVKVHQGRRHDDLEMYGRAIELGPEWRRFRIALVEFRELIFSHPRFDGGKASGRIDPAQIVAIRFAEPPGAPLPLAFYVDRIELEGPFPGAR